METGEEDEEVVYACRAKLYNFAKVADNKKEWKERGLGNLKLNVTKPASTDGDKDGPIKARFVMRAEGSHRVILNTPVRKELRFGDSNGGAPTGGIIHFMGSIDGKPQIEFLQLKVMTMLHKHDTMLT